MFIVTTVIINFITDLIDIKLNPVSELDVIHYHKDKISHKSCLVILNLLLPYTSLKLNYMNITLIN